MQTDVLIIGGGLSGLSLADRLTQAGVDFLLVEALERLGGRILTREIGGGAFDLGPAWFWPGQPRLAEMIRRFELSAFEQYATGDLVYQDQSGAVQRGRGFASMEGSLRLDGGMGRLTAALESVLSADRIMCGAVLQSLTYATGHVTARLAAQGAPREVKARRVVLAVPPRVLAQSIIFEPALSAVQMEAMTRIPTWMAGQAKILAVYDEPHWREAGLSGDAMSQRGPMVEIHDASPREGGPYALFGFVGVPPTVRDAHEVELKTTALEQLVAMFGPAMAAPRHYVMQDWAKIQQIAAQQDLTPIRRHPTYGLPL